MNIQCCGPEWQDRGKSFSVRREDANGYISIDNYQCRWQKRMRDQGWSAPWPGIAEGVPSYRINSEGWRSNTTCSSSGSVWFVGCSETFGQSVPQGETMVEHYESLTGCVALNLGWPGGSNVWNAQLTINRLLECATPPDWVFFQWTFPGRFYIPLGSGEFQHCLPQWGDNGLRRRLLDHYLSPGVTEQRQWQAYSMLQAAFGGNITHWTGFDIGRIEDDIIPRGVIQEWGMPFRVPEDLAQDAAHSNGSRHLRWAECAAKVWPA